jgi:hypothetical protein
VLGDGTTLPPGYYDLFLLKMLCLLFNLRKFELKFLYDFERSSYVVV